MIQVIPAEHREDRAGEMARLDPMVVQAVGRDLQHRVGDPRLHHFPQDPLQIHRLGCRVLRMTGMFPVAIRHRADHTGVEPCLPENRFHEIGERGLSVGPGDPDQHQLAGGIPEESGCRLRHRLPNVRCLDKNGLAGRGRPLGNGNGKGSPVQGLPDELPPIHVLTGEGEEEGPGGHLAGIIGQVGDLRRGVPLHPDSLQPLQQRLQLHSFPVPSLADPVLPSDRPASLID